jgi:hypothetical protein
VLTPELLEVLGHSLTAFLGVWLGLTVLTRSGTPAARVFGFLALALVAWSISIIVERLSLSTTAVQIGHTFEELAAALIVPATAHVSLVVASEGHPSRRKLWAIVLAYVANVLFALPGAFNTASGVSIAEPNLSLGPIPGAVLGWAWIVVRLGILATAAAWLVGAVGRTKPGTPDRRRLVVTLAVIVIGGIGGSIRIFSVIGATPPWIGVSLVTLATVLSASVVFGAGVFFPPDVADRAFRTSLARGLGLFVLIGVLLAVDTASRRFLGLEIPLLTVIALVVTIAVYEPVISWSRTRFGGRSPAGIARERLLTALGRSTLHAQGADAGVQPALTRMTQALNLAGAVVVRPDGSIAATQGTTPDPAAGPAIALVADDELMGELRVGHTLSGSPLGARDMELLRLSAEYVAAALRTGRREDEQAAALSGLSQDRANVESSATMLHEALVRRSTGRPGLYVFALGPLRVEREAESIERWGGEKAGARQALGLFAFLFDRGERGVAKDEALELIWPDTDVERADLAFHRTLGALRHTLDPDGQGGKRAIRFHNDRYRLDPTLVDWSDVAEFLAHIDQARATTERADNLRALEAARSLYRGEYLDDCPFYGDSALVEERRASLRGRSIDLLIGLGEGYEANGDRASAAAAYREAVAAAVDGCPPAVAGLGRLAAS